MVDVWLPYGKTDVCVRVSARNLLGSIEPIEREGAFDPKAEVERALKEPIASKRLSEIAKPESKVAIVVDDATRKAPSEDMLLPVLAELNAAGVKDENITVIFINNAIYGMTGGQMAPTTLIGQKATTCVEGRTAKQAGYPIRMSEMLATIDGAVYLERTSVHTAPNVLKAKNAIKKAFQNQIEGKGFSMVEVLSMCPTNWGTRLDNPSEATKYVAENMMKVFPLGVYKDSVK